MDSRLFIAIALASCAATLSAPVLAQDAVVDATVLELRGSQLSDVLGADVDEIAVVACHDRACRPIPFQVDERTPDEEWALPLGPNPVLDNPPEQFDANDLLLWLARDAGDFVEDTRTLPPYRLAVPVEVRDQRGSPSRWVYLLRCERPAPRSPIRYVDYDPNTDLLRGERVALGFTDDIPDRLIPVDRDGKLGRNLLDRFKVRAGASVLWNLLRFSRSEGDLSTLYKGWHTGPIRVIRRQQQRVRLGWGIRSPLFSVYTFFCPDYAKLPVGLWLNFKPTYFFSDVRIDVRLDFRDLSGWQLTLPGRVPITLNERSTPLAREIEGRPDGWFALAGPDMTLAQTIDFSESLHPARRQLRMAFSPKAKPPEATPGERPGIGYRLDHWERVGPGAHALEAVAYAFPPGTDIDRFMEERDAVTAIVAPAIRASH